MSAAQGRLLAPSISCSLLSALARSSLDCSFAENPELSLHKQGAKRVLDSSLTLSCTLSKLSKCWPACESQPHSAAREEEMSSRKEKNARKVSLERSLAIWEAELDNGYYRGKVEHVFYSHFHRNARGKAFWRTMTPIGGVRLCVCTGETVLVSSRFHSCETSRSVTCTGSTWPSPEVWTTTVEAFHTLCSSAQNDSRSSVGNGPRCK